MDDVTEQTINSRLLAARVYLRLVWSIPGLFRKYDAPQALRIAKQRVRAAAEALFTPRGVELMLRMCRVSWYLLGPALFAAGSYVATTTPTLTYRRLFLIAALMLAALTLGLHALGQITLSTNGRESFRPLAMVPGRVILLGAIWMPIPLGLSEASALKFAAVALVLFMLVGPTFTHWVNLISFQTLSPRRASIGEAQTMSVSNEATYERTVAHEAGHALIYGLGNAIPEDLYMFVETQPTCDDYGGAVTCVADQLVTVETTVEHLRFRLLVLIAGSAGERVHFGTHSIGGLHDFAAFEKVAFIYMLTAGLPMFAEPDSEAQHAINAAAIAQLRTEMMGLAEAVIRGNIGVYRELMECLYEHRELAYDDLIPILAKVRRIDGVPISAWPSRVPTHYLRANAGSH